ncbi:MAG: pilus assembly protein N-terminal domain-containing protein, partial [Thermoguttaceae bacterium]
MRYAVSCREVTRRSALLGCFLFAMVCSWTVTGPAQTSEKMQIAGLPTKLRVVPQGPPRPAEGTDANQRWKILGAEDDRAPVASFIDTIKGNDAAVQVIVGQGRLLTLKKDIASKEGTAVVAVGDPTVIGFEVMPNPRMIRIVGKRAGVTDFVITTADGETYALEVHVVYDLELLRAQLAGVFPDAYVKLGQIREHVVVEGQARSPVQVSQILQTIEAYLQSVQVPHSVSGPRTPAGADAGASSSEDRRPPYPPTGTAGQGQGDGEGEEETRRETEVTGPTGGDPDSQAAFAEPTIINLLRVPGVQQVSLRVQIAELNRTGLRQIGADILGIDPSTGNIFGTQIGGARIGPNDLPNVVANGTLSGLVTGAVAGSTTAFGIFPSGDFSILLRALRQNNLLSILAEPNLMAMSGHEASFLAGGKFPVPVSQYGAGLSGAVTVQWEKFGVQLNFTPYVLDDNTIRLAVMCEVSSIDESLGTTLVVGGEPIPGLNTRTASTTVELKQGQTLTIAGLLQVEIEAQTNRIPGLGDLPYIGPMFSNTSHERVEKELLVMVTPYLVEPMEHDEVPCLPT